MAAPLSVRYTTQPNGTVRSPTWFRIWRPHTGRCRTIVWYTIGSTNPDWRSFLHNDEVNAVILGRDFAAQMEATFAVDLTESDAITLDQWQRRSLLLRLKERTARLGAYWL